MRAYLERCGFPFKDNFLEIPENMEHLKIDVGLSENAPQSQQWIASDSNTFVFGFEPITLARKSIESGNSRWTTKLDPKYIGSRMAIVPCALYSKHVPGGMEFNVTDGDPGCSSLLTPVNFGVAYKENVEVWTIEDFVALINPGRFPIIDHLKIDVQGADFEVIKGIKDTFTRFLAVTVEIDTSGYQNTTNDYVQICRYMRRRGFFRLRFPRILTKIMETRRVELIIDVGDPTFINYFRLIRLKSRRIYLYQRG